MLLAVSHGGGPAARALLGELATLPGEKRVATLAPSACPLDGFAVTSLAAPPSALLPGVHDLVLLPTVDIAETGTCLGLVRAAAAAGVRRVHFMSRVGADRDLPVCLVRWAGRLERAIADCGLPHTVLRCAPWMQNIPFFLDGTGPSMRLVGPLRDATFPWIDIRDVGAIIRGAIAAADGTSLVCQIGGVDDVGLETIAEWLGAALGRPLPYVDVFGPEMEGLMARRGIDPRHTRAVIEYWDYVVSGVVASRPCPTAAERLGRPPRRLAAYLDELARDLLAGTVCGSGAIPLPDLLGEMPPVAVGRPVDAAQ